MSKVIAQPGNAFAVPLVLILSVTLMPSSLNAQTLYGTLVGNVSDPSNASIPAAKISAVNSGTGFSREAVTDERGGYQFSDLQPGVYRIAVTASGFSGFTRTDVQVTANSVLRVDV